MEGIPRAATAVDASELVGKPRLLTPVFNRRADKRGSFLQHSARFPGCTRPIAGTKMAATATLSSKLQISLPKAVREEQHSAADQELVFIPQGKGVLVMPVPELAQLAGIARGARTQGHRDRQDRY